MCYMNIFTVGILDRSRGVYIVSSPVNAPKCKGRIWILHEYHFALTCLLTRCAPFTGSVDDFSKAILLLQQH